MTLPAKLAIRLAAVAPRLAQGVLALASRLLPGPDQSRTGAQAGRQSEGKLAGSFLFRPMRRAARRNNELG